MTALYAEQPLEAAGELLKALASPVRLGIVRELASGGRRVHELVDALGGSAGRWSRSTCASCASQIATARRQAREIEYTLADDHVAHIVLDPNWLPARAAPMDNGNDFHYYQSGISLRMMIGIVSVRAGLPGRPGRVAVIVGRGHDETGLAGIPSARRCGCRGRGDAGGRVLDGCVGFAGARRR